MQSSNPADFGSYQIELTATVNGPDIVGGVDIVYTFNLGRCQLDSLFQTSPISDLSYTIGTGPKFISTNIENNFPECGLSFELTQNGQAYDTSLFELRPQDRLIVLQTDDRSLNSQFYNMVLTVTGQNGNQVTNSFKVTFEDKCSSATLTGSEFFVNSAVQ